MRANRKLWPGWYEGAIPWSVWLNGDPGYADTPTVSGTVRHDSERARLFRMLRVRNHKRGGYGTTTLYRRLRAHQQQERDRAWAFALAAIDFPEIDISDHFTFDLPDQEECERIADTFRI